MYLFSVTLPCHCSSLKKLGQEYTQGRNQKAGASAEVMEDAANGFAPRGFLSLLSYRNQDHQPQVVPPTMAWALPHQSLIKKMPYGITYSLVFLFVCFVFLDRVSLHSLGCNLMEAFSQLRLPSL